MTAMALPGVAAAAPWSAPAPIPGAGSAPLQALFTAAGTGVVLSPSQLAVVAADGTVTSTQPLSFAASAVATYGTDQIAVAGRALATSGQFAGTIDDSSAVVTRVGTPAKLGATRVVPGTTGRRLYALASNRAGLMALVVGTARTRTVLIRRPGAGSFAAKLRIRVSARARGATVAVGAGGDILFVYEDAHEVRARHIGRHGAVGAVHRLGAGVQSDLQALVGDDGRLAVAWKSQRVNEGEAATPAIVSFATAAPGHGFGAARTVATVGRTGAGRYVAAPGVRLLATAGGALLAYTGFEGADYTVEARQVSGGRLGPAERLSPSGIDAVLGDAAAGPAGAQIVTWRAGVAGADASGRPAHTPVLANVRAAAGGPFGAAEAVSPAGTDVAFAPVAALDPVSGRAIVAYGTLGPALALIASRPAA
ncbi:MAG TPA: hypothetical protein VL120_12400 [Solirubrobacteraceae bacterium]|nr:hypothetical protein [Solirubrobacteraceae bacterium]